MKILNVIMTLDKAKGGGTVERTVQMSRFLAKNGFDCGILATDLGVSSPNPDLSDVKITVVRCLWERFYLPAPSFGLIGRAVRGADIVHFMNHWNVLNAIVYFYVRKYKKPYVICPAGALPVWGRSKALKHFYNLLVGRRIVKNADRCIAITKDEVRHFLDYGVAPERIVVIPNGIALTEETPIMADKPKYPFSGRPFIVFIGRLNPIKGPDMLLEAFTRVNKKLSDIHLVFIGPDEGLLGGLKTAAMAASVSDRVHFTGFLDSKEKTALLKAAAFMAVPSRSEAMSIVALEAGAAAKPVLITDQCGFGEIAQIGGGLVVPASVEGLADGIERMSADLAALNRMGENLRVFVERNYSWDVVIREYVRIYSDLSPSKSAQAV